MSLTHKLKQGPPGESIRGPPGPPGTPGIPGTTAPEVPIYVYIFLQMIYDEHNNCYTFLI